MVYRKEFRVKTREGNCLIAEVYADDTSLRGAALTKETKKRLQEYLKHEKIEVVVMSPIQGYSCTHKSQETVILREPRDYEVLLHFREEYADVTYEIPVEWTGRGTVKVIANSVKEAEEKVKNQIKNGTCEIKEESLPNRHDLHIRK